MFLATTNKSKRLLQLSYIDHVTKVELENGYEELTGLMAEFPQGFRLLADFGRLESIDLNAVDTIGKAMELFEKNGLELVVRLMPDPSKDIGFKIIGIFHYKSRPRVIVCETMVEAIKALKL